MQLDFHLKWGCMPSSLLAMTNYCLGFLSHAWYIFVNCNVLNAEYRIPQLFCFALAESIILIRHFGDQLAHFLAWGILMSFVDRTLADPSFNIIHSYLPRSKICFSHAACFTISKVPGPLLLITTPQRDNQCSVIQACQFPQNFGRFSYIARSSKLL